MDWSMNPLPNSNLQPINFQLQGSCLTQQVCAFSQANTSSRNSYIYPRNGQIVNIQSNAVTTSNLPSQNAGSSNNFPKTSATSKSFGPLQNVQSMTTGSHSGVFSQMVPTVIQNTGSKKTVHTSSSVAFQGSNVYPMQNAHQKTLNLFMTSNSNNHSVQNYSNSVRTPVYQQSSNHSLTSSVPVQNVSYNANGSRVSHVGQSSLGATSSHQLNPQQNVSYVLFPLGQNIQNQASVRKPNVMVSVQSQQGVANPINPPQYVLPTDCHNRNTTQVFPQTTGENSSVPYQTNYEQFIQPRPITNLQNYHSLMLDQSSNIYSPQHGQKNQSATDIQATDKGGRTLYIVNGSKTNNNLSNELAKSSVKVGDYVLNPLQVAGPVHPIETSAPQMSRTLEQDKSSINTKENFPEKLFKDKVMIRKGLVLDIQKLHKLRTEFALLKEEYKAKLKMYQDVKENAASDHSVHNQNSNLSPPSYNSHPNLPVTHETNQGFQVPSRDASQSKLFSSVSSDSNQIKDDYLLLQNTGDHLLPILKSLLEDTTDKDILNAFIAKGDVQKSRLLATEWDSSHTSLVSSGDMSEKNINKIDTSHSLTFKTPPVSSTEESLICTKSGLGLEMSSVSAKNQLEKIPTVSSEGLFHRFDQNKSTAETFGQYLKSSLESSGQHAGERSLLLKKLLQKVNVSTHSSFSQQDKKSPENLKAMVTCNSKDASATSSSTSLFAKMPLSVQETGSMQQPSVAGNDCKMREVCSLEELETSLALWRKSFPTLISRITDSTGSSSSIDDEADGKKMQQSLENPSNMLGHNDRTQVTNEIAQNCALPSLGKSLDTVSTNSLKGSDLQVAIVSPLILSKDNVGNYVRKNNPCTEITRPVIEESGVHDSQEMSSVVPDIDRGKKVCSPSSGEYNKDLDMSRKAVKYTEENRIVKTETETNSSCILDQVADDCSSLQRKHKSQFVTGDRLPSEVYTGDLSQLPQNDVTCQSGSDLLEFGNTAEDKETGTLLQISSVCTLVQGDVSYDSQIANIFSTSPLKSSIKCDTSEEFMPLHSNDPHSDLSKSELGMNVSFPDILLPSPNSLSRAIEMFKDLPDLDIPQSHKASDEKSEMELATGKNTCPESMLSLEKKLVQNVSCSNVHCADVTSDQQILPENEKDQLGAIQKDSIADHVLVEENQAHFESSVDISLSDQLAELSKEFPYGIGDLEALNVTEGDYSVTEIVEKEGKDNSKISGDIPDASDKKDEIKMTLLNHQEMKEVFSEYSSNKSENHQDDQLKMDLEKNLRKENVHCLKTEQGSDIGSKNAPIGTTVKCRKTTYCCLQGWMASFYSIQPCSCMLAKEAASKQKEDLDPQSDTIVNDSLNCKAESGLNSQSPAFTFITFSESVPSGVEQNKTLHKAFTSKELKEHTPSKVDKVTLPLVLGKVHSQETERSKEQMMAESSTHATSLPLKTEIIEINEKHDKSASYCLSTEKAQHCSITGEINMVPGRNIYKVDSGKRRNRRVILKSKTETCLRRQLGKKTSVSYERYRIKHDSSETHIIKGPVSKKRFKKQMAMKKQHKSLADQHGDVINASHLSSIGSVSERHENSECNSTPDYLNQGWATYGPQHQRIQPPSEADAFTTAVKMPVAVVNASTKATDTVYGREEHQAGPLNCLRECDLAPNLESLATSDLNGKQLIKIKDFEKQFGYRKGEHNKTTSSEHRKPESEHRKPESEHSKPESEHRNHCIKMINLQKFAYSKERKNAWKYRNSDRIPLWQKQRGHMPNVSTKVSLGKEDMLDAHNRDVWSEKFFADKKPGFRRTSSFQREQKKSYLNRLAFRRTAQKTIRLTTLESSYSKPTLCGWQEDRNSSSSLTQDSETDKQILEFKMCPEILFRNPVSEEQISDAKKLPEKDSTPIVAIKSKREDWLNYIPVKRRKTEDNETQADDAIPLATAIKLVSGDEALPAPVKDSSATFLTYQKMHLEKTSHNMDASPSN